LCEYDCASIRAEALLTEYLASKRKLDDDS